MSCKSWCWCIVLFFVFWPLCWLPCVWTYFQEPIFADTSKKQLLEVLESNQIDAIASSLEEHYINKCTGKKLDIQLQYYKIDYHTGQTKEAQCAHLAGHLVQKNMDKLWLKERDDENAIASSLEATAHFKHMLLMSVKGNRFRALDR